MLAEVLGRIYMNQKFGSPYAKFIAQVACGKISRWTVIVLEWITMLGILYFGYDSLSHLETESCSVQSLLTQYVFQPSRLFHIIPIHFTLSKWLGVYFVLILVEQSRRTEGVRFTAESLALLMFAVFCVRLPVRLWKTYQFAVKQAIATLLVFAWSVLGVIFIFCLQHLEQASSSSSLLLTQQAILIMCAYYIVKSCVIFDGVLLSIQVWAILTNNLNERIAEWTVFWDRRRRNVRRSVNTGIYLMWTVVYNLFPVELQDQLDQQKSLFEFLKLRYKLDAVKFIWEVILKSRNVRFPKYHPEGEPGGAEFEDHKSSQSESKSQSESESQCSSYQSSSKSSSSSYSTSSSSSDRSHKKRRISRRRMDRVLKEFQGMRQRVQDELKEGESQSSSSEISASERNELLEEKQVREQNEIKVVWYGDQPTEIKEGELAQDSILPRCIQIKTWEESDLNNMDCGVCLFAINTGDRVACTPCLHHLHHDCLQTWVQEKIENNAGVPKCPLCMFELA